MKSKIYVGLALDVFDLIANEIHCIHTWWRGEGYTYSPDTKSDIHSIASSRQAAASWSHVSICARAQRYVAIPPTRVLTVTDLRNAELKGEGRGEKGEGGGERRLYNIVVILGR
jgi:hypothetical protein